MRSLSNIKIKSIHTSCAGCHVVCLDIDGAAWIFGRSEKSSLGNLGDGADELFVSESSPVRLTPRELGAPKGTTFVEAACGRNHTLLVGSNGQFWSAGVNQAGQVSAWCLSVCNAGANHSVLDVSAQCAQSPCAEVTSFKLAHSPEFNGVKEKVVKAAAGMNFSLVLTDTGKG